MAREDESNFPIKSIDDCINSVAIIGKLKELQLKMNEFFNELKNNVDEAGNNLNKDILEVNGRTFEKPLEDISNDILHVMRKIDANFTGRISVVEQQSEDDLDNLSKYNKYIANKKMEARTQIGAINQRQSMSEK